MTKTACWGGALLAAAAAVWAAGGRERPRPTAPLPARPTTLAAAAQRGVQNRGCEGCHADIAREWLGSRHRQAATNLEFAAAYRDEPDPFCWGCHAPEAPLLAVASDALAQAGVACVTCHVDARGATHGAAGEGRFGAPHAVQRDEAFRSIADCGACHEFAFPDPRREHREMMQTTLSEHARSPFAAQSCADCHMPRRGADQHRSHAFASTRDPRALRGAVQVVAERDGNIARFRVRPNRVGHAFPTGDLFRRLRVAAEVVVAGKVVRREQRFLARHFVHRPGRGGSLHRVLRYDDRPGASAENAGVAELELDLSHFASEQPIRWQVSYERVQHLQGDGEDDARVAESVSLARGELLP